MSDMPEKPQGCLDSSCRIQRPVGMSTNGGCRCFRDYIKMQRFITWSDLRIAELEANQEQVKALVDAVEYANTAVIRGESIAITHDQWQAIESASAAIKGEK